MSLIIFLVVAFPSLFFYFKVGRNAAVKAFPAIQKNKWEKHAREYPILALRGKDDVHNFGYGEKHYRRVRNEAMTQAKVWVWFWPILYMVQGIKHISGPSLNQRMLEADPDYQEEQRKILQERIKELERELEVN